ncbi:DNA-binding protein WhiA [Fusobacterium pseudoperiodonticum]|uniref:Probable cell division protein WhiA n=1 Tax=Fusobacterium pseudoperiodonticum TaxID=2663009 RepID=A0A2G9E9D6_9FUSO|nr:DNA-binding protein WhiA [Fusobacterium pseudoperiodonticum]ATV63522.1 DNA-binding protein WhiA [Fusobacterium pseudoperiodonticum]ATV66101.1 DNA-binding protein WhiA [Fusobacterium pseudoperiodonticum]ATV71930.1 DNA-binding protein WhiA [Fusobacterium pseudoperiodonticum]PIM77537.1 DNA-binding protein WhiA [Fusobacterium pseudoperiodonticum]
MSYSSNVKQEITQKIPVTNLECLAEISAIFENKANLVKEGIEIKMENSILAKRLYSLIKATSSLQFGIKYSITKKFTEHRIYVITLYKQKGLKEFLESFKFSFLDIIQNDEIFRGYLRGFFLSCGYIKDPKKEYSLDFFVDNKELADKIYNILLSKKKKIFKTIKKNKILVYLRNSEDIMDLLVSMNALKYFFEYEEITIIKNLKNKTIREMNWEVANETKTLNTGNYQIKMIKYIDEKLGLNTLTDVLKEAAMLRLNNPEDSLQSLADMINISKSGIRNRFRRIEEIYNNLLEEENS